MTHAMTSQAVPTTGRKPTSPDAKAADDVTVVCKTADDLYRPVARRLTGRLLSQYLEGHHVTPTELLHSPTLQKHAERDRSWQTALHRAAEIQARHLGVKASDRVGALTALTTKARKRARALAAEKTPPAAAPGTFSKQVATLRQRADNPMEAAFLIDCALTQYLQGGRRLGREGRAHPGPVRGRDSVERRQDTR